MADCERGAGYLDNLRHSDGGQCASRVGDEKGFRTVDIGELMNYEFKPREQLLGPWLKTQSLCMVHAWRGVGKTYFSLNVAYAVASGGSWLGWHAEKPRKVLYLDGEMPGESLQKRLEKIAGRSDKKPPSQHFRILTPDMQPDGITPNFATFEGRQAVSELIESDTALIIVDNLSALLRGAGPENDAQSWEQMAGWALQMRARGHSILYVHHAGKGGTQRGTSKKEDILDTVICLSRPANYEAREGARFEVHFEKSRDVVGEDVSPIEACLKANADGLELWEHRIVEDVEMKHAAQLKNEGAAQGEIAEEMGKTRHQVSRILKRAAEAGLIAAANFERGGKRRAKTSTV